jgi:signal transduction histidine kinase
VQLQQVILNLIMNAIEAMAATDAHRRIITIRTSRAGAGTAEITIADHGNGIAPEHHSRVGEPFFTTKQHGLGLGLSLCSTIIRSHGGEFAILNNDGGGAIATISLPPEPSPIDTL